MEDSLWVLPRDLEPSLVLENIDPDDEMALRDYQSALDACASASQLLWALSGRKYHSERATEEYYTAQEYFNPLTITTIRGQVVFDSQYGIYVVDPYDWGYNRIRLNGSPINSVVMITDIKTGQLIMPDEYTVINRSLILFRKPLSGGIEIIYDYGQEPPTLGRMAALQLARQFFYLWSGRESECQLPDRVQSVNREGVSWVLMDNQQYIDDLRTGVYAVDLFLRSVNPGRALRKSKVFSVDIPRGRRRL